MLTTRLPTFVNLPTFGDSSLSVVGKLANVDDVRPTIDNVESLTLRTGGAEKRVNVGKLDGRGRERVNTALKCCDPSAGACAPPPRALGVNIDREDVSP